MDFRSSSKRQDTAFIVRQKNDTNVQTHIDFKDRSLSSTRGVGWKILVVSLSLPSPHMGGYLPDSFL